MRLLLLTARLELLWMGAICSIFWFAARGQLPLTPGKRYHERGNQPRRDSPNVTMFLAECAISDFF
jgi:hypothetical protein